MRTRPMMCRRRRSAGLVTDGILLGQQVVGLMATIRATEWLFALRCGCVVMLIDGANGHSPLPWLFVPVVKYRFCYGFRPFPPRC